MITVDELLRQLESLKEVNNLPGDTPVIIDCGEFLTEVEDIDLGGSDEGVVIWCGERVEQ